MCLWQVGRLHLALQKYDILGVGDKVQWVERLLTTHRAPSLALCKLGVGMYSFES